MIICCCPNCRYIDLLSYIDEKPCLKCGFEMIPLGIKSIKWNQLSEFEKESAIDNTIRAYHYKVFENNLEVTYQNSYENESYSDSEEAYGETAQYEEEYEYYENEVVNDVENDEENDAANDAEYGEESESIAEAEETNNSQDSHENEYYDEVDKEDESDKQIIKESTFNSDNIVFDEKDFYVEDEPYGIELKDSELELSKEKLLRDSENMSDEIVPIVKITDLSNNHWKIL